VKLSDKQEWARKRAMVLMLEFGLGHWVFRYVDTRMYTGFARCEHPAWPGVLELALFLPELNPREVVEDTIRHEIAHGIAYIKHRETGHGPAWVEACKITGARPEERATWIIMPKL